MTPLDPPAAAERLAPRIEDQNVQLESTTNAKTSRLFRICGSGNTGRRTLGIVFLLTTILLWTASNFLASDIFADDSYSKPYFITYFNVSFFALSLIPATIRIIRSRGVGYLRELIAIYSRDKYNALLRRSPPRLLDDEEAEGLISPIIHEDRFNSFVEAPLPDTGKLSIREHADQALLFMPLYFLSNYLVSAGLEHTSVGSATIVSSTSSMFTLIFGAILKVEQFNWKKLIGVLASFAGILLVSLVDLSSESNDENRGLFPHKSAAEIAVGNTMALISAILFGSYAVLIKKKLGDEDRVDLMTLFGFLGLFSFVLLWPGLVVLHLFGVEKFEIPPTGQIWIIVLMNALASYISDLCWACAMLLTTPLVVSVGLSMAIPISLIVQMFINQQFSSWLYWLGAIIVVSSFLLVNNESHDDKEERALG